MYVSKELLIYNVIKTIHFSKLLEGTKFKAPIMASLSQTNKSTNSALLIKSLQTIEEKFLYCQAI